MPTNKLVCPHCGHDGTEETARPPLGSFGFNYLAEGVVCREVRGYDEAGRLRLSGDFKCEGSQTTNARLECRSCWRTFQLPDGLVRSIVPEPARQVSEAPEASVEGPQAAARVEAAADDIGRNLLAMLRIAVEESGRASAARVASIESSLTAVRDQVASLVQSQDQVAQRVLQQAQAIAGLAGEHELLREEMSALAAASGERTVALENALQEAKGTSSRLGEALAQVQDGHQTTRQRLDTQAEVIRALHAAAQEQISRREELRSAVQRLEQLAGGLDQVQPLPDGL